MATLAAGTLDRTLGALLVGDIVGSVLYGITLLQTFLYYVSFPTDRFDLKVLVAVLCVLDTAQLIMGCHALYYFVITNYGRIAAIDTVVWSLTGNQIVTSVIAFVVQAYMIRRIHILSQKNWFITVFLGALTIVSLVFNIVYGARLAELGRTSLIPRVLYLINTALSTTFAIDVLITFILAFLLHKSRTGMRSTDSVVNTLIIFAINTGAVTSLCALLVVIVHQTTTGTIYIAFYVLLSKLYVNSFLATLNARQLIRGRQSNYMATSTTRMTDLRTDPTSTLERSHGSSSFPGMTVEAYPQFSKRIDTEEDELPPATRQHADLMSV